MHSNYKYLVLVNLTCEQKIYQDFYDKILCLFQQVLLISFILGAPTDEYEYIAADIKLHVPEVNEAGLGIVPTASTSIQLAIGDALAVACLNKKKFSKYDFSRLHPSGNLGAKLKTVEDLMLTGQKIPFINENLKVEGVTYKDAKI